VSLLGFVITSMSDQTVSELSPTCSLSVSVGSEGLLAMPRSSRETVVGGKSFTAISSRRAPVQDEKSGGRDTIRFAASIWPVNVKELAARAKDPGNQARHRTESGPTNHA